MRFTLAGEGKKIPRGLDARAGVAAVSDPDALEGDVAGLAGFPQQDRPVPDRERAPFHDHVLSAVGVGGHPVGVCLTTEGERVGCDREVRDREFAGRQQGFISGPPIDRFLAESFGAQVNGYPVTALPRVKHPRRERSPYHGVDRSTRAAPGRCTCRR